MTDEKLRVLYADDAIVVLDKPTGMLSVPGRLPQHQDALSTRVMARYPQARVVHRLDCETSGVMVMALSVEAQRHLNRQFHDRKVTKDYTAICHGVLAEDEGEIQLPLIADWPNRPRQMVDPIRGKPAHTRWQVTQRWPDRTRLALKPITGRSHQLRVHLLAIGHPILGDSLYGSEASQTMADRLLLHALALRFRHPVSGQVCRFMTDCPF